MHMPLHAFPQQGRHPTILLPLQRGAFRAQRQNLQGGPSISEGEKREGYQHFSLLQKLCLGSPSSWCFSVYVCPGERFGLEERGMAAVRFIALSPAASLRASTTRRTRTAERCRLAGYSCTAQKAGGGVGRKNPTGKCLLDVDHFSRTRLHEAALPRPCPFQPRLCFNDALALQIALVADDALDWRYLAIV